MKKLTTKTKAFYGLGFAAQGIKDGLFQLFLFFYFSQILGLDATLTGISTLIALAFDAISDPIIGAISDNYKSEKWGRRHPFMLASALPFGLFIWLLFLPPTSLSQTGLFWWMTIFTILVRLSMTFFLIPGMSLGAELTDDFEERNSVTSYRVFFAAIAPPLVITFGLLTFFTPTAENANGLFNAAAYPKFALLCGLLIIFLVLISTWGTRDTIPNLPKSAKNSQRQTFVQFRNGISQAFKLASFRNLITYIMWVYIGIGVGTVFTTYYTTYFFGLSEKELAAMPIGSFLGGVIALFLAPYLGKKLDKKPTIIWSTLLFGFFFSLPFNLRLLGWFPENDAPLLLPLYILAMLVAYLFIYVSMSISSSMMADVVDEYELHTGERQEGMFFAALSFAYKCTIGLGYVIAGVILNYIAFPKQAMVEEVPAEAIRSLGVVGGPLTLFIYCFGILFILFYPINKARYLEIRQAIDAK